MSTATEETPRRYFTAFGPSSGYGGGKPARIDVPEPLGILSDGEPVPEGNVLFRVCTPEDGDQLITWNPLRLHEVAEAKRLFNELIGKGYYAYKLDPSSGKRGGEVVRRFEEIVGDGEVMMASIRPSESKPTLASLLPDRRRKRDVASSGAATEIVMHPRPVGG